MTATAASFIDRVSTAANEAKADGTISKEERARIAKLASEFESNLLVQMLRDMRTSGSWDNEDQSKEGLGAESMFDQMDVELANHLTKVRGLGLADELTAAIQKLQKPGSGPELMPPGLSMPATLPTTTPTAGAQGAGAARHSHAVAPSAARSVASVAAPRAVDGVEAPVVDGVGEPDAVALAMPGGKVTSQFGWRHDPFTGQAKFHRGVDLRAAYGQEVNAAGAGTVVFSGEQRGYGNTVVVEHANGTRSRYAHLSATLVSKGDRVDSSTPVGRAGHSGRATGTHLHFEITNADGHALPPEQWTTRPALMASAVHQVNATTE